MCGIASVLSWDGPIDESALRNAMASLRHRGPDGGGVWISADRSIGLGHARLSIIDLETGGQPIASEDERIHAIVNGEFYGFENIRRDLQHRGHRFITRGDSEILLHLYEEFGDECLAHLRGEFAFVLWDARARRLFAGRDRFGIKPLCYAIADGRLLIASEAKALFAAGVRAQWDHASAFQAASLQYVLPDRTLFLGVRQVPPGHFLSARDGKVEVTPYWDMDFPRRAADGGALAHAGPAGEAELCRELRERLTEAGDLRLRADVPVCFHLSGGLDSSTIAGLAAQRQSTALNCFTVSFDHDVYDELPTARDTARYLGANLHVVPVSQRDLLEAMPAALYHGEGLAINGHLPAKFLLAKAIHEAGFKVVLSGEGADEILAGYPHLREDFFRAENPNEGDLSRALARLYAANPMMAGIQLAAGASLPLGAVQETLGFIPAFLRAKATLGHRMRAVLNDDFTAAFAQVDCCRTLLDAFDIDGRLRGRHPVDQSTYLWSKLALATYILRTLGDGTEMAHSVEGRLPFLDHRLFDFASRLPMALKIKETMEKYLLREAARLIITDTVYRRQKQPFTAPPLARFTTPAIEDIIRDRLQGSALDAVPFLDRAKIRQLLDRLPHMDPHEQVASDPVLMLALSFAGLQEQFRLEVGA